MRKCEEPDSVRIARLAWSVSALQDPFVGQDFYQVGNTLGT